MIYGIRDQDIFGDQGSGFEIKYGITDQHTFWTRDQDFSFEIRITATRNFCDQGSNHGIKK